MVLSLRRWNACTRTVGSTRSAHQVGVLHSDLTPANLMLLRDGRGRVLDVGLAQPLWRPSDAPAAAGGSPLYMVPEQRRGAACSDRTDCYALDLLLREMLTGEAPQPRGAAPAPPEDAQGAPPLPSGGARSLAELADRGLRPSAAEIEAALAACAAEFPASSTPAERPAAPLAEVPAGRHPAGAGQNAARPSGPLGWPRPPRRGALLLGGVLLSLAAVVHAKRGGALRPVPLPPCPRSATARRKRCWGPSRATTTILSDDAPPVQPSACAPQVRSCRLRSKN